MKDYPALEEIGISTPEKIERFSLQTVRNVDILRIVYKRKKGSLLHTSKKFRFGRAEKMVVTDSGTQATAVVHEISPFVIKLTDELRSIVKARQSQSAQKEIIMDEIRRLEEDSRSRIAYIKTLISELD